MALVITGLVVLYLLSVALEARGRRYFKVERKRLMTPAEVRFWRVLNAALPEYRIFGQVAMGALLKPVSGLSRKDWWSTYGRFSQKIVDFVVVSVATGDVVAVVELDDPSHDPRKDAARDALLGRGGYVVLRFTARDDLASLRHRFEASIDVVDVRAPAWRPSVVS